MAQKRGKMNIVHMNNVQIWAYLGAKRGSGMNKPTVGRQDFVRAAQGILAQQGWQQLNMRNLASACGVSLGCVYNYFPAKADLLFTLVQEFWQGQVHTAFCGVPATGSFEEFCRGAYAALRPPLAQFRQVYAPQLAALAPGQVQRGKQLEQGCFAHMRAGFLQALLQDGTVPPWVWGPGFGPRQLADFAFDGLMARLMAGRPGCEDLIQVLHRVLHPVQQKRSD